MFCVDILNTICSHLSQESHDSFLSCSKELYSQRNSVVYKKFCGNPGGKKIKTLVVDKNTVLDPQNPPKELDFILGSPSKSHMIEGVEKIKIFSQNDWAKKRQASKDIFGFLPKSLKKLFLHGYQEDLGKLPDTVENLHIISGSFLTFSEGLPKNLKELHLYQCHFEKGTKITLPEKLQKLILFASSDVTFSNLPRTLEKIDFSSSRVTLETGVEIPMGTKFFCDGKKYESQFNLPDSIEELFIEGVYKPFRLPTGLKKLSVDYLSFLPPQTSLPDTIKSLEINSWGSHDIKGVLPKYLENLSLRGFTKEKGVLPKTLKTLKILASEMGWLSGFEGQLNLLALDGFSDERVFFPKVKVLKLAGASLPRGADFSEGIESVDLYKEYKKEKLPTSLLYLRFHHSFNEPLEKFLPKGLKNLVFGNQFNQEIKGKIPDGVIYLVFGRLFKQKIKDAIPESVTHLTLPANEEIDFENLPPSILVLRLGGKDSSKIFPRIPKTVKRVFLKKVLVQDQEYDKRYWLGN